MIVISRQTVAVALLTFCAQMSTATFGRAQSGLDRVHRIHGVDSGQITAVTPLGITISKNGVESTIPVEDVEGVYLAGEPAELNTVRTALQAGRIEDALRTLDKISTEGISREEILAEIDFYRALAQAKLALGGRTPLDEAISAVRNFMATRRSSFHVPQSLELLGDLLSASGQFASARIEYAKLAKAKSVYFKLLSELLLGRSWQAEGKHAEAIVEFEKVLTSADTGSQIDPLKLSAKLDLAVSQAASGRGDDGAAAIAAIIASADAEDSELMARAYNALGDCYLAAKDSEGALFAFLHVDLLYNDGADAHAKALHELVGLWQASGHATRSQEAAQELSERYPESRWTKK